MECPDAERLAAVASGADDPDIAAHVVACAACARVSEALRAPDDIGEPVAATVGDPEPGDTVGRYVILGRLGAGGMGVVSSAYDPTLDRVIALKSIRADRASPALARRLEREAQSLAKLTHPHLVRVFDAGVDRGRLYLAMELVDGTTLDRWLQTKRDTAEIVRVFREVAEALAAVHAAGFVHRDVKPENILIDTKGVARLADFGLVAPGGTAEGGRPASGEPGVTDPFTAVGTPAYMSPEQRRGADVDARSDQWSWAISLRHALAHVDGRLARIIDRASHDDAHHRFARMDDIVAALAPRRRRVWPFAVASALAAVGAVALVVAMRSSPADPCAGGDPFADWTAHEAAVARAFEASGHPSWAARLDATARASRVALTSLADTSVAVCRAAEAARRSDDQEQACLAADRATVRALIVELARADRAMVDRAPLAATLVPRGVHCRDVATHDVVRTNHALGGELERLKAKALVRAPKDVVEEAGALAQRATEAGAAQLEGEAKLLLGELQSKLRDDDAARTTLDEAALAAARAHDDRVAALARLLQAGQAALLTAAPERAAALGEVAVAAVARAGNPAELRGQLENVLGGIAFSRGKFGEAEAHYRASIAARTEAFGAGDHRTAQGHQNLGIALARLGRTADARHANETAVAILERALGPDHPDLAAALNSLGTLAADDKRYDDATALFERTRALRVATFGPDHPDVAISENNLGKLANLRGARREAIAHYERSLAIVEAKLGTDALEVALPLSGLAAVHADLEEWALARPFGERAIAVAEARRGKDHPALISMLITYANIQAHTGEAAARRATLARAYAIAKSKLGVEHAQTVALAKLLEEP